MHRDFLGLQIIDHLSSLGLPRKAAHGLLGQCSVSEARATKSGNSLFVTLQS